MNKDNARDYLPLVQALAEGKEIQERVYPPAGEPVWSCVGVTCNFTRPPSCYRIKPEPVKGWYRVATLKHGVIFCATTKAGEALAESQSDFVRWLTGRIEYEVEA